MLEAEAAMDIVSVRAGHRDSTHQPYHMESSFWRSNIGLPHLFFLSACQCDNDIDEDNQNDSSTRNSLTSSRTYH
jgi:hypothetical protein